MPQQKPEKTQLAQEREKGFLPAEPAQKKKSMRGWWIKTVLMLALICVSVAVMFGIGNYISPEGTKPFSDMVRDISVPYLLLLLGVILIYIFVESSKYAYLLKVSTGKFRIRTSVKTMFLGKYYDGITPMSTGGQPFQIYYLHKKHDVPKGVATAIPLVRYLVSAIVVTLISIALLIVTPMYLESGTITTTFYVMSWISIAINCLFPVAIILFSVFPNRTKRLIAGIINLLARMHVVKRKYETMIKWTRELGEYREALKMFAKKIKYAAPLVLLSAMETVISYSVPFFTVIAIAGIPPTGELYLQILCLSTVTRYTALLIPTPGNTGAVETAGSLVFITVSAIDSVKPVLGWAVLVWRFFTYYMYILSGIGISIFEIIRSAVRNRRSAEK